MSKAVLISIRPQWCELIASGEKTIEVRKTAPKIETPFKCYIYETQGKTDTPWIDEDGHMVFRGRGAVIGEFVCDKIYGIIPDEYGWGEEYGYSEHDCLSDAEMAAYLGDHSGFGWHISDLVIYDEPIQLRSFMKKPCDFAATCGACRHAKWLGGISFDGCDFEMTHPPQSWCYVEELP